MREFKKACSKEEPAEFFISLGGGLVRSSKSAMLIGEKFVILNEADNSEDVLTEKELFTKSNIGEAIEKGALYSY